MVALTLDLGLLAVVFGVLRRLCILNILYLGLLLSQLAFDESLVGAASFIELREALSRLLLYRLDLGVLGVDLSLGLHQICVELVDLIETGNLALLVVDDIFLFFANIVDRCLNLGCQVLHKHLKVVLLLLVLDPAHGLLFLFQNVYFFSG